MFEEMMTNATAVNATTTTTTTAASPLVLTSSPPPPLLLQWMIWIVEFRKQLFLDHFEPLIVKCFGPVVPETNETETEEVASSSSSSEFLSYSYPHVDTNHRRLGFLLPDYISNVEAFKEQSMSFATLFMLFMTLSCVFLIFLSCFYHNQKTSPLFTSPRRHRLPKLVPPPLPVDGYFKWVRVCFYMSDEEIINRIGYDTLIFLRFHRLALRCIVKMSVFSFIVLLPLNFTGGGHANAQDLKEYVGSLFFTDFLRFTMANVVSGSPRLWVHCFAAYLLTAIVVRELLIEYETFNSIRHRYLLSREPHLRTVLVTNIPRHLRSASKITSYFKNVYPNAVNAVFMCQNCILLEQVIHQRTRVLSNIEKELLLLCRSEKRKLYEQSLWKRFLCDSRACLEQCGCCSFFAAQERLATSYALLEELNGQIENEQRRRKRVMKMLDRMDAGGEGAADIDYVLAAQFFEENDPSQRRVLGLSETTKTKKTTTTEYQPPSSIPEGDEEAGDTSLGSSGGGGTGTNPNANQQLRSRSPATAAEQIHNVKEATAAAAAVEVTSEQEADGIYKGKGRKKKKARSFAKAKRAIRRYGRFHQDVSFLGRPIRSSVEVQSEGQIENHINEVTDKAFVVMRTFTAATIAIQSMHSSKPGSMQVTTAPEPRDILWNNIYVSKGAHRMRSFLGMILVLFIIVFYIVPITIVSLLVSESALISSSPRLAQLAQASAFFSASIALVQPLCIVGIQQLLPPLFMMIGQAEGIISFSEVQMRAFSRYFLFQVVNVFLVTTIAGSIFDTVALIVASPETAFELLGNSLPRMSSFFITFVTIKTFLALGFELVRTMALVQATIRYALFPNATLRQKRTVIVGMRSIDDPGWFPFHKILAQDMLVVVISVVFAVVAPLVLLPCAVFYLFSRVMWTHHHLFVYESVFESGGQFWPKIFRRFVFGLIIAQMTITGQFILKDARFEAYATFLLMCLTYFFLRSTRARYDATSSTLPLELATVMDISLQQEEAEAQKKQQAGGQTPTDAAPSSSPVSPDGDADFFIGRYDPFRKAYLQPALRANPRARPEQPFPAAQLGPEEEPFKGETDDNGSTDSDWQDSGATVRLKSLNQQDRRLINRWWKDQLQRAGVQNLLAVLIGEECGTLRLSGASAVDMELKEQPTFSSRTFV